MAALILENWLAGRKRHIWFSVSPDLYHDARRDLDDLLAAHGMTKSDLPVYRLRLRLGLGSGLGLGLRLGLGLGLANPTHNLRSPKRSVTVPPPTE